MKAVLALALSALAAGVARAAAPETLDPARPIEGQLGGEETRSFSVSLKAGQFLHVLVEQRGIDVVVGFADPSGRRLVERDAPTGAFGTERISVIVADTGVHLLTLSVLDKKAAPGRYVVRIAALRASHAEDLTRIAAQAASIEGTRLRAEESPEARRRALRRFEEALSLWRAVGDKNEEAVTYYDLVWLARENGENRRALELADQGIVAARAAGDRQLEARLLDNVGLLKNYLGDAAGAADILTRAIQIARSLGDFQTENEALNKLGWSVSLLGQYQRAIDTYRRSIDLARLSRDRLSEAWPTVGLALAYARVGETAKALETYARALALWREIGNKRGEILALQDTGFLYWSIGESRRALEIYCEVLPIARAVGDRRGEALTWNDVALAEASLGYVESARQHFTDALAIWRAMGDRPGEIQTVLNLGGLEESVGRRPEALALYRSDLALARSARDTRGEARALIACARIERKLGDLQGAMADIEPALEIIESQREELAAPGLRASFLSAHQDAYGVLVDVLADLDVREPQGGHAAAAFSASERGRARGLLDAVKARAIPAGRPLTGGKPVSAGDVLGRLRPDTALVSFWMGGDRVLAFVAAGGRLELLQLPAPPAELAERVEVFVDLASRGDAARADAIGRRLYRDLVEPWRRRLPAGVTRLVVVPDRVLHSLPLEALKAPGQEAHLVLADFVVAYAPSAAVFLELARRPGAVRAPPDLAVFVDGDDRARSIEVAGERFDLAALPYAAQEGRAVGRYGRAGSVRRSGDAAPEPLQGAADLGRFGIIHFATHGLLSREAPERSALVLAARPGERREGRLEAQEIRGLKLSSELVVLSACQTARGKILPGEGVEGLAQAFFHAGARTVVGTLWNVNDRRSAELMESFYRNMARGEPKADALRSAKLELTQRYPGLAPRYWAPFVLLGEPDGVILLQARREGRNAALWLAAAAAAILAAWAASRVRWRSGTS